MARSIEVRILGDASSLSRELAKSQAGLKTFDGQLQAIGKRTSAVGKTLTRDVSLPLVAVGVGAVKMAQGFDLIISRLQGLAGVSAKQASTWREELLKLAPVVGKAPAELADGLYQITSAGVKGKAAFEALTVSAKASAAGLGDTATVADAVTSAMNAYAKSGLTAKNAADVLTATVREGKGEASQFAPVLGKVVAVAAQLGVKFSDVGAALAGMTRLGVSAEDASTQLSATFSALLKTTPKAEKALEAMGLSSAGLRQELREKGLLATLQTLAEKTKGSSTAMAEAFPNVRALRGILQLVGSAANGIPGVFDRVKNSTNSLSTAWNAYTGTDAAKMNKSLAETKVALIELGGTLAPFVDKVAKDVGRLASAYNNLSPHQKEFVTKLGEVAIVAGPALIVIGKITTAVGVLSAAFKGLAVAEGAASAGLAGPGGLIASFGKLRALIVAGFVIGNKGESTPTSVDPSTGHRVVTFGGKTYDLGPNPASAPGAHASTAAAGGADRSNHPGVQGAGGGMMWSGDHGGLKASFKASLAACVADAGGTQIYVSSGRRTKQHNTDVGGASNSNHLTGSAADGTCTINGRAYPLGAAPINYAKFGLRPGSSFNWGGSPDIYHVDDGTNVGGTSGGGGSTATNPNYDPLAGTKTKKTTAPAWKGLTQASLTSLTGSINATLRGTAGSSDPVIQNARKHIKAIEDSLHLHMPDSELAKDKVALAKWGKKLRDEVTKNAKAAAAAAAEAKKKFERALSLDVSHILRDFDRQFAAVKTKFDKETASGLAALGSPSQTPEEKALADFLAQRQAQASAEQMSQAQSDLAAAIATGDPVQIKQAQDAIDQILLDQQQASLEQAAADSRAAADQKAADAQQAYQDQRDAQWQSLQDINDDQRIALQNSLDDWTTNLEKKKASWTEFIKWLGDNGYSTAGLIDPNTGTAGSVSLPGGISVGSGVVGGGFGGSFAAGGIVPGALGQPKLILAHGGERVVTAAQQSSGLVVHTHVVVDGRELMTIVQKHAALDVKRGGAGVPG